jgi:predicted acetyltransferase
MFECIDFKHYLENPASRARLVKLNNELAGFVLLNKVKLIEPVDWNMGEFFILAKFQNKGIGDHVAHEIFKAHQGEWSVAVMPKNIAAVHFWQKIISDMSDKNFVEVF